MQDFELLQNFLNATLKWLEHVKSTQVISDPENPCKQFRGKEATSQFISTPACIEDEAKSPTIIKHSLDA